MPLGNNSLAHNSYIEYLYDYGIIGLGLLLFIFLKIVKKAMTYLKNKNSNAPVMLMSLTISFVISMFSYFFEQSVLIIPIAIFWGMCLGEELRESR